MDYNKIHEQNNTVDEESIEDIHHTRIAVVNVAKLNVRKGPGTQFPIRDVVSKGDTFEISKTNDDATWARLSEGGWIMLEHCDVSDSDKN